MLLIIILNMALLVNTVQAIENGTDITIYTKGYFNRIIKKQRNNNKNSSCCISRKWKRISSILLK